MRWGLFSLLDSLFFLFIQLVVKFHGNLTLCSDVRENAVVPYMLCLPRKVGCRRLETHKPEYYRTGSGPPSLRFVKCDTAGVQKTGT